jgi:L-lactate dehydrogenase (cytochrome)
VPNLQSFEALAQKVLGDDGTRKPWAFFSSFSDDGYSEDHENPIWRGRRAEVFVWCLRLAYTASRGAYSLLRFIPRVLVPVAEVDTSLPLLGPVAELPIFFAPTSGARMAHPGGEVNIVRAAARIGVPFCVASGWGVSFSDVVKERDVQAEKTGEKARIWFQLCLRSNWCRKNMVRLMNGCGQVRS